MPELTLRQVASWSALYGAAIFSSAFLLFTVQPLLGKMMLPQWGGSAAVWTTCLFFFQAALVLGYSYAYASVGWLSPTAQCIVHIGLLTASTVALPLAGTAVPHWTGSGDPTLHLLGRLVTTCGLPYLLLSSTGPLLQAWYTREPRSPVPYRLFALSNLASLLGLLAYPVLIEPNLTIQAQSVAWSSGYVAFALLCGALAWRARTLGSPAPSTARARNFDFVPFGIQALWVLLAACPSLLLVAITSHITENLAPIPFLWILPLSIYLLSFILCFESDRWYRRAVFLPLFVASLALMLYAVVVEYRTLHLGIRIILFCAALFVVSMTCHGELAALKPHPRHLTRFYLAISIGGMLGGLLASLVAPLMFDASYELSVGMVAAAVAVLAVLQRDRSSWLHRGRTPVRWIAVLILGAALAGALAHHAVTTARVARFMARNFYGALQVIDYRAGQLLVRSLRHGTIVHGTQLVGAQSRRQPTSYYTPNSGVGLAIFATRQPSSQRIGVVGLGTGTLAAYGRRGDYYRFYEINPLVLDIARTQFTYLQDCVAAVDVRLGDARLSLESEPPQRFDLLVIDAFSGDSVPLHLLTREAFATYFRHLNPNGALAVHVSNRYLDLAPVIKQSADYFSREARVMDTPGEGLHIVYAATWVLIGNSPGVFSSELLRSAKPISVRPGVRLWTDDFSSLYPLLR